MIKKRLVYIFFLLVVSLSALEQTPRRLFITTDMDLDDAIAIVMLLRNPEIEVVGISVAQNGCALPGYGVSNLFRLLDMEGRFDIPVAYGTPEALIPGITFPQAWRTQADQLESYLPISEQQPSMLSGSELLLKIAKNSQKPIEVIALAPATDLALALRADPQVASQISHLWFSGAAWQSGESWNIEIDPLAFYILLHSLVPMTIVTNTAQSETPITDKDLLEISKIDSPSAVLVAKAVKDFLTEPGRKYFWDPVTAAVCMDPSLVLQQEHSGIQVSLTPGNAYGQLRPDPQTAHKVNLVFNVDQERFLQLLNRLLANP